MDYRIVKEGDKFSEKMTITTNKFFRIKNGSTFDKQGLDFKLRFISSPIGEFIVMDFRYSGTSDYIWTRDGCIIVRIDDKENIRLPFADSGDRHFDNGHIVDTYYESYTEYNYVDLTKEILEKIMNASTVEIKVQGKYSVVSSSYDCSGFAAYCKLFYDGLYKTDIQRIRDASEEDDVKSETVSRLNISALLFCIAFFFMLFIEAFGLAFFFLIVAIILFIAGVIVKLKDF